MTRVGALLTQLVYFVSGAGLLLLQSHATLPPPGCIHVLLACSLYGKLRMASCKEGYNAGHTFSAHNQAPRKPAIESSCTVISITQDTLAKT
jgi:hypothetical protein